MATQPESGKVGYVDVPNAVRGASTGFSILLIGGLIAPMVTLLSSTVATVWITLVAVAAFAIAARKSSRAESPAAHGAFAALFAYALVLPLLLPFRQAWNPTQIGLTALTAIAVGSLTGILMARRTR